MKWLLFVLLLSGCSVELKSSPQPFAPRWPTLPVYITPSLDTPEDNMVVLEAMASFNEQLGMTLFLPSSNGVRIVNAVGGEKDNQGKTIIWWKGDNIFNANVKIYKEYPCDLKSLVMHELGHVLGLFHEGEGLMYPYLTPTQIRTTIDIKTREEIIFRYKGVRYE